MKKILCVVTSNAVKGATGIPTGFWLSELTHPLAKFVAAGISYELASTKGGKPPIDSDSLDFNDPINQKFWNDPIFQAKLDNTAFIEIAFLRQELQFFIWICHLCRNYLRQNRIAAQCFIDRFQQTTISVMMFYYRLQPVHAYKFSGRVILFREFNYSLQQLYHADDFIAIKNIFFIQSIQHVLGNFF
jgi:hypothetical protein